MKNRLLYKNTVLALSCCALFTPRFLLVNYVDNNISLKNVNGKVNIAL